MFETLGFAETSPREAAVVLGLMLGLAFGILGRLTRFCFRRAVAGPAAERRAAFGVWMAALVAAIAGTQIGVAAGLVDFADHRFLAPDLPWLAIVAGGLMFGVGMVLTRGCVSRLTVLAGGGNLRAVLVIAVFAITAHATLKGVLSPLRTSLGSVTLGLGDYVSLGALPGGPLVWSLLLIGVAGLLALRSGNRAGTLVLAGLIGLLVPAAWLGTGFILYDDFDPIALESLSFTSPSAETLFWIVASTSIPAGFGVGLLGGVLGGSLVTSLARREFRWESFEAPGQTLRYLAGGMLMGAGGVLAGGCTIGAGLSGIPTLSVAAILALGAIAVGGRLAAAVLTASGPTAVSAAPDTRPQELPAE